jgi:Malate/L-lactate dehydrogenase
LPLRNRDGTRPDEPDNTGHFFLAIDPHTFRPPGAFEDDLDADIDVLHATAPSDAAKPVLVAGEPEEQSRVRRLREGIPIRPALDRHMRDICGRCAVDYVLQDALRGRPAARREANERRTAMDRRAALSGPGAASVAW